MVAQRRPAVPITEAVGFSGRVLHRQDPEPFPRRNRAGIDPDDVRLSIPTGGWFELWYDWTPVLHSHFGYMVDKPDAHDMHTACDGSYNQVFFGNVSYD